MDVAPNLQGADAPNRREHGEAQSSVERSKVGRTVQISTVGCNEDQARTSSWMQASRDNRRARGARGPAGAPQEGQLLGSIRDQQPFELGAHPHGTLV